MGLFSTLFRGDDKDDDNQTIKIRQNNEDTSQIVADRYTHVDDNKHVHESYNINTSTGDYREYSGGENADDRSHNK